MQVTMANLRKNMTDILNRVARNHERILVTSRGQPKAVIVPVEDLGLLQGLEQVLKTWEKEERGEPLTLDELDAELGLAD